MLSGSSSSIYYMDSNHHPLLLFPSFSLSLFLHLSLSLSLPATEENEFWGCLFKEGIKLALHYQVFSCAVWDSGLSLERSPISCSYLPWRLFVGNDMNTGKVNSFECIRSSLLRRILKTKYFYFRFMTVPWRETRALCKVIHLSNGENKNQALGSIFFSLKKRQRH